MTEIEKITLYIINEYENEDNKHLLASIKLHFAEVKKENIEIAG